MKRIRERLKAPKPKIISRGDLHREELARIHPCDYTRLENSIYLDKHGKTIFKKLFKDSHADMYNQSMMDESIDCQVERDNCKVEEQHAEHIAAIKDRNNCVEGRIAIYNRGIEHCNNEMAEIHRKYSDIPETDKKHMKELQQSRTLFYKSPICMAVVVIGSCTLDYTTIYTAVETLLTQKLFLQILLCACIAILINVVPAISGVYMKDKDAENRKLVLSLMAVIFFVLFIITFLLRFATMDALYEDTSQLFEVDATTSEHSSAEIIMTLLLAIEPLLSSILSLVFGFISETPEEKDRKLAERRMATLFMMREDLTIRIDELDAVLKNDYDSIEEEEKYRIQIEMLDGYRKKLKEDARVELSKLCKKPEANGRILQREPSMLFELS